MSELDDDRDEEWFKEVYGTEYTGPPRVAAKKGGAAGVEVKREAVKRPPNVSDSEEDDEPRDPNAVPTDFTSREAKVWEAKAKAVERNWKRRKEEELTCRLCGEVGHFAQGCPTTLGGIRKSGEVMERISLRDKRLKPRLIGTGGAIVQGIEKETGCRLKLEDNLSVGNGAFFVKITGADKVAVNKAVACVNKLVDQVEDEWRQARKAQGREQRERPSSYQGGSNPVVMQQQQAPMVRPQQESSRRGDLSTPPLDEEKRTIEHIASQLEARRQWKAGSLNGCSYKEGVGSLPPAQPVGKLNGAGAYYSDVTPQLVSSYPEHELEMNLEYDAHSLDELERRFLEETIALTKDQNKEEDKENARHRERLREIQEQFQHKMTKLRAKQAKNREDFLRAEAHRRYQSPPGGPNYSHYQYGGSGSSLPPRSTSSYVDPLASHAVSAYVDPLPQYEGSYEGSFDQGYDKGYDPNPADSSGLQSIRSSAYDSYPEAASYSPSAAYNNRKPGSGYESSNAYNTKSQVYDTKPYSYGTSSQYPAYG